MLALKRRKRVVARHGQAHPQPSAAAAHSRKAAAAVATRRPALRDAAIKVKLAAVVSAEKTKAAQAMKVPAKLEKADRASLSQAQVQPVAAAKDRRARVDRENPAKPAVAAKPVMMDCPRKKSLSPSQRPSPLSSMQPTAAAQRS
jgi:hypothetical protein